MRQALVVSLFIGLSSGFIVPSGVAKAIHNPSKNVSIIVEENSIKDNLIKINKINDNEIYQNIDNKTNNVNERSFILINSKFNKMRSNQLFRAVAQGLIGQNLNKVKSLHKQLQTYTTKKVLRKLPDAISDPENMFKPNDDRSKKPQYVPSVYRYEYPDPSVNFQRNKTHEVIENVKQNLKFQDDRSKWMPVGSEPIVKEKSVLPTVYKSDDGIGNAPSEPNENTTVNSEQKPGPINKKMRITSFTQRKPNQYHNCGFLKPNALHRSSFLKKLEGSASGDNYSPIHIDGPNLDSSLGNMYDDDEKFGKLERYIKETLTETGKYLSKEAIEPSHEKCVTGTKNQDDDEVVGTDERNSFSKLDEMQKIIENANIESKEYFESIKKDKDS